MIAQSLRFLPALLLVMPMCLFVVLSAPAWLCWPFLPEQKQRVVIEVMQKLVDWTRACRHIR
ncbi:hypothetical protein [Streptomyces sp. NPDC002133]|uniref:hypothetical protein n=1 Tax=Streptomyces sp. NPDC002133 TaxID=3154409 RepID=UPI003322A27D